MDRRVSIVLRLKSIAFCAAALSLVLFTHVALHAQLNVTTFGIQVKPMIPNSFFTSGTDNIETDAMRVEFQPRLGWNFGMVIRRGITNMWSFETGINMVQRNYTLHIDYAGLKEKQNLDFRYICYEIPVQGIVFVKLGENLFMNASGGFSFDLYPSNVETSNYTRVDSTTYDFSQKTWKNKWVQVALLANYGFEWRTRESGYFYFGASYHRPFNYIGITRVVVERNKVPSRADALLRGNYLTADFRYFFNEKPERRKPIH